MRELSYLKNRKNKPIKISNAVVMLKYIAPSTILKRIFKNLEITVIS
jgi:hypothetical protein